MWSGRWVGNPRDDRSGSRPIGLWGCVGLVQGYPTMADRSVADGIVPDHGGAKTGLEGRDGGQVHQYPGQTGRGDPPLGIRAHGPGLGERPKDPGCQPGTQERHYGDFPGQWGTTYFQGLGERDMFWIENDRGSF